MIYRTKRADIENYFNSEAINQSQIKLFSKGVDAFFNTELIPEEEKYFDEKKEHFKIGSAADTMLTEGEEAFNQLYYISTLDKIPSDTIVSIVRQVYDSVKSRDDFSPVLDNYMDEIVESCQAHNYQPRWGAEAKFNGVIREGTSYWLSITEAGDRDILTMEQMEIVKYVVNSIEAFDPYKKIVDKATPATNEEGEISSQTYCDIFYQVPLYFTINSVACKVLIDMLVVDHDTQLIDMYDFKTMWDAVEHFPKYSNIRRYDIQGSFYHDGVVRLLQDSSLKILLESLYSLDDNYPTVDNTVRSLNSDYHVADFSFIVQSTVFKNSPSIYVMDSNLIKMGREGRSALYVPAVTDGSANDASISELKFQPIKGYRELLRQLVSAKRDTEERINPPYQYYDWYGKNKNEN